MLSKLGLTIGDFHTIDCFRTNFLIYDRRQWLEIMLMPRLLLVICTICSVLLLLEKATVRPGETSRAQHQ